MSPLNIKYLGLLGSMIVLSSGIDLKLAEHCASERSLRQHALYSRLDDHLRMSLDELIEGLVNDSAGEAGMMVIYLLLCLVAGQSDLCGVDDDDVVTYVYKRSELRLVLAAEAGSNLSCNTADGLAATSTTYQSRLMSAGFAM